MPTRPTRSKPSAFRDFGLNPELVDAIEKLDYVTPTPIQTQAIPLVLQKRDVLGCAQTGTGKTAAFALPILTNMGNRPIGKLRCLVLTPTRELAIQVAESFRSYTAGKIQVATAIGGVEMRNQLALMKHGADVLVATPGRLMDHMYRGNLEFSALEVVVLDEADRMLDMGFIEDVEFILSCLPKERQTLLFSATLERAILDLAAHHLNNPVSVDVAPHVNTVAEGIRHTAYLVKATEKRELVRYLINRQRMDHVIVFTRTKIGAEKLSKFLEHTGIEVGALHSDKSQSQRIATLNGFKKGKIRVLVATDVAARGLDVSTISHVINFDVPGTPEAYVHRSGRTARAGSEGDAITLVAPNERHDMSNIAQKLNIDVPYDGVQGMTMSPPTGVGAGNVRDRSGGAGRGSAGRAGARRDESRDRASSRAPRREGRSDRDGARDTGAPGWGRSASGDRDRDDEKGRGVRGSARDSARDTARDAAPERSSRRATRGGEERDEPRGGRRDSGAERDTRRDGDHAEKDGGRSRGRHHRDRDEGREAERDREPASAKRGGRRGGGRDRDEGREAPRDEEATRRGGRPSRSRDTQEEDREPRRDENHARRGGRDTEERDRSSRRARPERPGRREESGAAQPRRPTGASETKKRFW